MLANATLERSADDARGAERAPRPRGGARASFATPPMGYNSWNFYHCNIDEHAIKETAQALIDTGLRTMGGLASVGASLEKLCLSDQNLTRIEGLQHLPQL